MDYLPTSDNPVTIQRKKLRVGTPAHDKWIAVLRANEEEGQRLKQNDKRALKRADKSNGTLSSEGAALLFTMEKWQRGRKTARAKDRSGAIMTEKETHTLTTVRCYDIMRGRAIRRNLRESH